VYIPAHMLLANALLAWPYRGAADLGRPSDVQHVPHGCFTLVTPSSGHSR
jgi:hypothetical protein